jgi:integrase
MTFERSHGKARPSLTRGGVPIHVERLSEQLRADLERVGVNRPQSLERSAVRQPVDAHDLRATFITISLATGKTETWIMDRTGHTTSAMVNRLPPQGTVLAARGTGSPG